LLKLKIWILSHLKFINKYINRLFKLKRRFNKWLY
jgi:hypothetical protein